MNISVVESSAQQQNSCGQAPEGSAQPNGANPFERQIADLESLNIADLRTQWVERIGGRSPPIQSGDILRRLIAWKLQEKALGGLDGETASRLARLKAALVKGKPVVLSPGLDLRPGTILTREWRGILHKVLVLDQGFELQGTRYASLSKVARAITGTRWSGPRFFGLEAAQEIAQGSIHKGMSQ